MTPFDPLLSRYVQAHAGESQWLGKLESVTMVDGTAYVTLSDAAIWSNGNPAEVTKPLTREEWLRSGMGLNKEQGGPEISERGTAILKVDALREIPGPK
jgi:hypothetical protein